MSDSTNHARKVEVSDINGIMRSRSGRNFMIRVIEATGVFRDQFDENPLKQARNNGRASLGHWLMAELEDADPGNFQQMMREYYDNRSDG